MVKVIFPLYRRYTSQATKFTEVFVGNFDKNRIY